MSPVPHRPEISSVLAAAVLSASMSSLSSALNALSTISVTDFYRRYWRDEESDAHYLGVSRAFTVLFGLAAIPLALVFVNSGGSILETLSRVASFFVGAKLAMFGLGFLSKHTTERGLLVGVVAGFLALYVVVMGVPFLDWDPPTIAWPWYVVIGGAVNIAVSWGASVLIDGFQSEWHEQTVPGQRRRFREQGLSETSDGWYVVPGRIDRVCWGLLVFFALTVLFLSIFATLGSA